MKLVEDWNVHVRGSNKISTDYWCMSTLMELSGRFGTKADV